MKPCEAGRAAGAALGSTSASPASRLHDRTHADFSSPGMHLQRRLLHTSWPNLHRPSPVNVVPMSNGRSLSGLAETRRQAEHAAASGCRWARGEQKSSETSERAPSLVCGIAAAVQAIVSDAVDWVGALGQHAVSGMAGRQNSLRRSKRLMSLCHAL